MRYSLLAAFILLLGTSCSKNDSNTDLPPGSRLDSVTTRTALDNTVIIGIKYKYDGTGNLVQYVINNKQRTELRYDAQNRITTISNYGSTGPASADTFVYSANRRIVRSYRYAAGTPSLVPMKAFVFDNSNRVTSDSTYFSVGNNVLVRNYFKYSYDAVDNLNSAVEYSFAPNSPGGYSRQDSLVYAYDGNENPRYKYSNAINFSSSVGFPLSKHNAVTVTRFFSGSTPASTSTSYQLTYYKNGLLRTQLTNNGASSSSLNSITEFLYR